MARFADLPNEIVLLITAYVEPPDLDNFFLILERIRQLNISIILTHLQTKQKYQRIALETDERHNYPRMGTWAGLLCQGLNLSDIASIIENLNVRGWNQSWSYRHITIGEN